MQAAAPRGLPRSAALTRPGTPCGGAPASACGNRRKNPMRPKLTVMPRTDPDIRGCANRPHSSVDTVQGEKDQEAPHRRGALFCETRLPLRGHRRELAGRRPCFDLSQAMMRDPKMKLIKSAVITAPPERKRNVAEQVEPLETGRTARTGNRNMRSWFAEHRGRDTAARRCGRQD